MKRIIAIVCGLLAALAFAALASAQHTHAANSPKAEFHLSQPLAVGDAILKVGDDKFQCRKIDGQDVLVVTSADDGKEVARVPCRPEQLETKTEISELRSVPRPAAGSTLSAVRIKGETIAHRVALH